MDNKNFKYFFLIFLTSLMLFSCNEEAIKYVNLEDEDLDFPKITATNSHTGYENTFCNEKSVTVIVGNGLSSELDSINVQWNFTPKIYFYGPDYHLTIPDPVDVDTILVEARFYRTDSNNVIGERFKTIIRTNENCSLEAI